MDSVAASRMEVEKKSLVGLSDRNGRRPNHPNTFIRLKPFTFLAALSAMLVALNHLRRRFLDSGLWTAMDGYGWLWVIC